MFMTLLTRGLLETHVHDYFDIEKAKKKAMKYHWLKDTLYFQNLVVPKLEERKKMIEKMHEKFRHFNELKTLT
jgi:hypothetical protein